MTTNELHEGDPVRITGPYKQNPYRGEIGTIESIGIDLIGWTIYLIKLEFGTFVYYPDEIERVESEVQSG